MYPVAGMIVEMNNLISDKKDDANRRNNAGGHFWKNTVVHNVAF
jgi:glycine cleavage system H lipoate-binding protein